MHKNHNAMFMINVHFIMYNLYEPMKMEKIEIIRSQEFMPSEARLKFLKKKRLF